MIVLVQRDVDCAALNDKQRLLIRVRANQVLRGRAARFRSHAVSLPRTRTRPFAGIVHAVNARDAQERRQLNPLQARRQVRSADVDIRVKPRLIGVVAAHNRAILAVVQARSHARLKQDGCDARCAAVIGAANEVEHGVRVRDRIREQVIDAEVIGQGRNHVRRRVLVDGNILTPESRHILGGQAVALFQARVEDARVVNRVACACTRRISRRDKHAAAVHVHITQIHGQVDLAIGSNHEGL